MKLRQDLKTFILYTYKYACTYTDYNTNKRYVLVNLIPKNKRLVITYKMQEKVKRTPLSPNTCKIFRCYKNTQLSLSLGQITNGIYTTNIKVLQFK